MWEDTADELRNENSYLQHKVDTLMSQLESKDIEIDQLTSDMMEMADYIKDLETALAEAYLMSKADDEPTKTQTPDTSE